MAEHPSGAWVHDLDPFLWRIHGDFGLRWYGLAYLAGIVIGGLLIARWARRGRVPLTAAQVQDFALCVGISMIVGGRLGFCAFYDPSLFGFDAAFPYWGVLRMWDGGMASHGGIVGLFLGCWIWSYRQGVALLPLCDAVCAVAPIGVIAGRLANFINGELWGRVAPAGLPWAVVFPAEDPRRVAELPARHPSQLYAVGLEGLLPLLLILPLHARHRRPGVTMGLLLAFYAIGRFVGEFWREPDAGQPGGPGGPPLLLGLFSKGQALTVPLLLIGLGVALWAWRRGRRDGDYLLPTPDAARG